MTTNIYREINKNKRIRITMRYFVCSVFSLTSILFMILFFGIHDYKNPCKLKELYNSSWDEGKSGGDIVQLYDNNQFNFIHWNWEYGSIYLTGTWEMQGDTLTLNASGKNRVYLENENKFYDFPDFKNAKYRMYVDSVVLLKNQNCTHRIFYPFEKCWRRKIKDHMYLKHFFEKNK